MDNKHWFLPSKTLLSLLLFTCCLLFAGFGSAAERNSVPAGSIAYGYNYGDHLYYYYALKGKTLYYIKQGAAWHLVDDLESNNAPTPGPIAVSFEKSGAVDLYMLSRDGALYLLSPRKNKEGTTSTWYWDRATDVKPLPNAESATSLVYLYNPKKDSWMNAALVNGVYYVLRSDDNKKTWYWKTLPEVPVLKPDSTIAGAADPDDGSVSIYAMQNGKLYLLKTRDDGKTWYWDAPKDVTSTLEPKPAAITCYYNQDGQFDMFALQNGKEFLLQFNKDDKTWRWTRTEAAVLSKNHRNTNV